MIRFVDMRQLSPDADRTPEQFEWVFTGTAVDDRGDHSLQVATSSANQMVSVSYDPDSFLLSVGGVARKVSQLEEIRLAYPRGDILLDATSLDAVEILVLSKAFLHCEEPRRVAYLYVEPLRYIPAPGAAGTYAFAFASRFRGLRSVPGFARELRSDEAGRLVACLGFEPERLDRILQDDDGNFIKHTTLIFGIPPYQASWEAHALFPHERVIHQQNIGCDVAFAAASNPKSTFEQLRDASNAVDAGRGERLLIAPLGSKPSSIGVALFACTRDDVRLKYDFPVRLEGRTSGVGSVHRYLVERR